jgi:hypothetical protein
MAGKMVTESSTNPTLVTSREPITPKRAGEKGSTGDQALTDALIMVGIAWAVLFFLAFSLRGHNI